MGTVKPSRLTVVVVCGPSTEARAGEIVRRYFDRVELLSWNCKDPNVENEHRRYLSNRTFDLAISFYNCFIFGRDELERLAIPINIHPATPSLPGWSHELLPFLAGQSRLGVTVHFMTEEIDAGDIIEVSEYELPKDRSLDVLREQVFEKNFEALDRLCRQLRHFGDVSSARRFLRDRVESTNRQWTGQHYSRQSINRLLRAHRNFLRESRSRDV